jgi:hypothetical protein
MENVPKPPVHQDRIEPLVQKNVEGWITYFVNLSPRIKIVRNTDPEFDIEQLHQAVRDLIEHIDENQTIDGFPIKESVAFVLLIDSNKFGSNPIYKGRDTYLFCSNVAFSLDHFQQDSELIDEDNGEWEYFDTFSLSSYSEDCLTWKFIGKLIKDKIKEIEQKIPHPPKGKRKK